MRIQRRHKRFKLDLIEIDSRVSSAGKVEIIDISQGGVALKADRKLDIGKECFIMLGSRGKSINVKGVVVRSELSGIEERPNGDRVTVYSVGLIFKESSADKITDFLNSIEHTQKAEVPGKANWRFQNIRFSITTPSERVLIFPEQFSVYEISLSGMLMQTEQKLNIDSMVLMELSLGAFSPVSFMGRVTSCRMTNEEDHENYEIGVEFIDLPDIDRPVLMKLIETHNSRAEEQ